MNILKRHPIICTVFIFIVCLLIGTVFGWAYAQYKIQLIAEALKQTHPGDPLDGLWLIGLGIIFKGLIIGAIIGAILGIAAFLIGKKPKELH